MAASPAFVGPPRSGVFTATDALFLSQTVFTAGVSGSIIKSFLIQAYGDTQLYATVKFRTSTDDLVLGVFTLRMTSLADKTLLNYAAPNNMLVEEVFPGLQLEAGQRYVELGPEDSIRVTIHDGAGDGPGAGEGAQMRILGADY